MPTQIDYADYRDVGGIKFPFEYKFLWLDGRFTAKITDVKTNVAIDAALFGKPSGSDKKVDEIGRQSVRSLVARTHGFGIHPTC